ncbi:MAG: hypothetical protein QOJ86_5015 [Bradyrhizobium sp.]|nr:hypothetical protein [Bradyrhizobium sp.]
MIIGNFDYDPQTDTYTGFVKTLSVQHSGIVLRPDEKTGVKGPDYRVVFDAEEYASEIGAAWKRTSEAGQEFLSVSIDDPSFERPINAALFLDDEDNTAALLWNRPKAKAVQTAETPSRTKRAKAA